MDELDYEILAVVKQQQEYNPDGTLFAMKIGNRIFNKADILAGWEKDPELRRLIRKRILGLKLHVLSRGTPK